MSRRTRGENGPELKATVWTERVRMDIDGGLAPNLVFCFGMLDNPEVRVRVMAEMKVRHEQLLALEEEASGVHCTGHVDYEPKSRIPKPAAMTPGDLLKFTRELHPDMLRWGMHGGCFRVHLLLALAFPGAEPWYDGGHITTLIDGLHYDIHGVVEPDPDAAPFTDAEQYKQAFRWSSSMPFLEAEPSLRAKALAFQGLQKAWEFYQVSRATPDEGTGHSADAHRWLEDEVAKLLGEDPNESALRD